MRYLSVKVFRESNFTLVEIEDFGDPEDKSHPKFDVFYLEFLMFLREREDQMEGRSATRLKLKNVVYEVLKTRLGV
jgi:glycyl-tRNA synthetase (class II)